MKAVSLRNPKAVEVIDIPEPELGPQDVLVQVHYVGLCGSDLNMYRGLFPLARYPRVLGHEVSGIIVAKGQQVPDSVHLGDQVVLSPYSNCGICTACRAGRPNCCRYNETLGLQRDGALSSHFAIHYTKVFAENNLPLPELALTEPLSVGYHAANRGRVSEIDTVLVIGCGTIGIGVIAAVARKGATVLAVDIDEAKLAIARKFGAQITVNSAQQDVAGVVAEITAGEGVNVAVEAVGLAQTFRLAVDVVCFAGRVVYVGYAEEAVSYDTTNFVRKELDIMGSRNALRVFPSVLKMLTSQRYPFSDLISTTYSLAQTADALKTWDRNPGRFSKILIDVNS